MTLSLLLTAAGIVLLFFGGEFLVRGSVSLAERMGVSPLLVGMTIVAAGTSAPELVVSVDAALAGRAGIAMGNVIGSNICNILLILGLSAALSPITLDPREIRRDLLVLIGASAALAGLAATGTIGRLAAGVLLVAQVVYVVGSYVAEKRRPTPVSDLYRNEAEELRGKPRPTWLDIVMVVGSVLVLVAGSRLLVVGATDIARTIGVDEAIIGLTLVALGTSLPELATSAVAALRGHSDVAVGNVVGSNIFNSLLIIGTAGLAAPIAVPEAMMARDIWVMLAVAVVAAIALWRGRLGRSVGLAALAGYVAYVVVAYTA
jgi:cation:H+ antiporter